MKFTKQGMTINRGGDEKYLLESLFEKLYIISLQYVTFSIPVQLPK